MKKIHHATLKIHTIYSVILSVVFLVIILMAHEATLSAAAVFLILYVTGNGIIHTRNNELSRDTLIEYIILAFIALILLIGTIK